MPDMMRALMHAAVISITPTRKPAYKMGLERFISLRIVPILANGVETTTKISELRLSHRSKSERD